MDTKRIITALGAMAFAASFSAGAYGQNTPRIVELPRRIPAELLRSIPLGQKPESDVLHLSISIPLGDADGLKQFADQVSDPKSPEYRHFLEPEEVGRRFGLPAYRVQRVREYLAAQGMSVKLVAKNRQSILVDATVAQAEAAFHTSIQEFSAPATDEAPATTRFSFTTPPAVPANLAPDIADVSGMDSFTRPKGHTALNASQIRSLYSAATMYSAGGKQGAGRTIAISNFDGFRLSNIPLEVTLMSLPIPTAGVGTNVKVTPVGGGTGNTGTASGEGDLDIQAVLCMAPLANVIVYDNYQASTTTGNNPIAVLTQELNDNTADIVTESYGWAMSTATALAAHNLHLSMTAQGITYMAASGDHGTTWVISGNDFDYPATDPEVLSVGGTSVTLTTAGARSTEVGWNSLGDFGGGGWNVTTDTFNTRPAYQSTSTFLAGGGVPSVSSVPYRLVPDVAFDADPNTGYLVYVSGTKTQIGGTSASSPTCAGMLALLEEQLISDGALAASSTGKYRLGRIQDLLYSFNGSSSVFYDVTSGTNGTLPNGVVSNASAGWDTDTGWGPFSFSGLLGKMERLVSSLTVSPTSVVGGASSTGTVTLTMAAATGGTAVALKSSVASAVVPASVTVAAGATSATFAVTTVAVSATTTATITASLGSSSVTANLAIQSATVTALSLSTTSVLGGASSTGTVTLSSAAATGGDVVTLKSSSTSATTPSSVTVAAGAKTATFTVTTAAVSANTTATITATLGTSSATASLTVQPASLSSVTLSAASVVGGCNVTITGTVTLSSAAGPSGDVVTLASSATGAATVPTSVTVSAGAKTATFTVTHLLVSAATSTTLKGTFNGASQSVVLAVNPFQISSFSLSPTTLVGGASSTGTVTLNATPGTKSGTVTVKLASSSSLATVATSASVAVGAATATFTVKTAAVTAATTSTITTTVGSSSKTATLTIQV